MPPRSLRTVLTRLFVRRLYLPCLLLLVVGAAVVAGGKYYELRRHQHDVVGQVAQVLAWGSGSEKQLQQKNFRDSLRQALSQQTDTSITQWFFLPLDRAVGSKVDEQEAASRRQRLLDSGVYQKARLSAGAVSGVLNLHGELVLTTLYSVPRLGLIVGGSYPLFRLVLPVFVGFCLSAFVLSAFFALLGRRLQHQLRSRIEEPLHTVTRDMERVTYDASPPVQKKPLPFLELQDLRQRFFEIARSLKYREDELLQSQERLNLTVNSAGLGLWDWNLPSGRIYASSRCAEILDYPPHETTTRITRWSRWIHPRDREEVKRRLRAHLLGQEPAFEAEFQMLTQHNTWRWVWLCGRIVQHDATDAPVRVTGTMLDIVKRKHVEEKLRTLTLAVAQNPVPMLISDAQGFLEYANPAYLALTELTSDEVQQGLQARSAPQFVDGAFMRQFLDIVEQGEQWQGEIQNVTKSGRVFWEFTSISPLQNEQGEVTHYVAVRSEISAQKQAESKLRDLATRDSLTGVWNRRYFFELAERELESALRYEHPLSLIIFDIDYFKHVNDTYGHMVGDEVLRQLTDLVIDKLRNVDLLARIGGEEFAVLLPHTYIEQAHTVAQRILQGVHVAVMPTEAGPLQVTISIGLSSSAHAGPNLESLIHEADQALYAAKDQGRNTICGPLIGIAEDQDTASHLPDPSTE